MGHQRIFKIDRGDPFTAALDQVLRSVDELHHAVAVDGRNIATLPPAVDEALGAARFVDIGGRNPRPTHIDLADSLIVPRNRVAIVVEHLALDRRGGDALTHADGYLVIATQVCLIAANIGQGRERCAFGRAPGGQDRHAVFSLVLLHDRRGCRRPTEQQTAQAGDVVRLGLQQIHHIDADRYRAVGESHLFLGNQFQIIARRWTLAGKHKLGAHPHPPAKGTPHELTWNIGAIGIKTSFSDIAMPSTWLSISACNIKVRWV